MKFILCLKLERLPNSMMLWHQVITPYDIVNSGFCEISCILLIVMFFSTVTRVLRQRDHVTALFGAEELWARGFTGRKVKMAIFDTGIRADHPHFRNIKV